MARKVNNYKTEWVVEKIKKEANLLKNKLAREIKIACLGMTFKPNVEDLRESPALKIIKKLFNENFEILVCEPNLKVNQKFKLYDTKTIFEKADLVVILVAHNEFKNLNFFNHRTLDFTGINYK